MPPPSRLFHRLFQAPRHELFRNIPTSQSSFSQRISHRTIVPRTRPTIRSFSTHFHFPRPRAQLSHSRFPRFPRRLNSSKSNPSSSDSNQTSLSQRLRKLSREYGWSALGVYLFLSALDFPFCFAAVRLLGVERIGHYEHVIVEGTKGIFTSVWPFGKGATDTTDPESDAKDDVPENAELGERTTYDHGVAEAQRRSDEGASIWTQLALAYAIHKSFIFIRVPLTAAVTPKVVHILRRWGWDIGKRRPKSS